MYLNHNKVVFCTLALGDDFIERVATQIQSVLKFSHHELYVITDASPEKFGNYYDQSRIHYVDFNSIENTLPLKAQTGVFNYHLKMLPIRYVYDHVTPVPTIVIYMDADSFLWGKFPDNFDKNFPEAQHGVWARFRQELNTLDQDRIVVGKLEKMGIDVSGITTKLPIENIMIFKTGTKIIPFLDEWYRLAKLSYESGATAFYEAVEMAIAINNTEMYYEHIDNIKPYCDCWRTLHNGKLHTPFVI